MTRVGRKRQHHSIRDVSRAKRTRARTRDMDQIFDDMTKPEKFEKMPENPDLPGAGQHYCVPCARHFISATTLLEHHKTKAHKKRVKVLKTEKPYTQADAEAAVGLMQADSQESMKMI